MHRGTWQISVPVPEVQRYPCTSGAEVSTVSVPMVRHALPAYYVIASGEASSNLAKFDGLRYGMRAETGGGGSEADGARLHESIIATRTQG